MPLLLACLASGLLAAASASPGSADDPLAAAEQLEGQGRVPEAVALYRTAIGGPHSADPAAFAGLAGALSQLGDHRGAVKNFKAALKAGGEPKYGMHFNIALAYMEGGKLTAAAKHFERAIQLQPGFREGHLKLASVLKDKGDTEKTIFHLQQAIELEPGNPNAYGYLGGVLNNAKRWRDAVMAYRAGLDLSPAHAESRVALADTLTNLKRYAEAGSEYRAVIAQAEEEAEGAGRELVDDPDWTETSGHGCSFFAPGQPGAGHCRNPAAVNAAGIGASEACPATCASEAKPPGSSATDSLATAVGGAVSVGAASCYWESTHSLLPKLWGAIAAELQQDKPSSLSPYRALFLPPPPQLSGMLLNEVAQSWAKMHAKQASQLGVARWKDWWLSDARPRREESDQKLRVGYISRRIEDYAGTHLMLPVYGAHDRATTSVHVFARGRDDGSAQRKAVAAAADSFLDLSALDTAAAAEAIRAEGVDVLIDYDGAHDYNNMELLALRMSPVQCSWIGFPASSGGPFVDCLIADAVVAPRELAQRQAFTEQLVHMPYSFTAAGYAGQQTVDGSLRRSKLGLPERSFVMCTFNRLEKLDERTFTLWLSLLSRIPQSVLWVYEPEGSPEVDAAAEGGADTRSHLLANAAAAGISGARLVFAGRLPKAQHLGRLRQADLFLDGAQYSAHTIAADSLWAGLPLLSCPQAAFASRVSASMAVAAGAALLPVPTASDASAPRRGVAAIAAREMLSMVAASWKEYADTASAMGSAISRIAAQSEPPRKEGFYSGAVRGLQASHPLFDTESLTDALTERLRGLAQERAGT